MPSLSALSSLTQSPFGLEEVIVKYSPRWAGSAYKAKQNRCRKLRVLLKFQSKKFLKIQEYPGVDDSKDLVKNWL